MSDWSQAPSKLERKDNTVNGYLLFRFWPTGTHILLRVQVQGPKEQRLRVTKARTRIDIIKRTTMFEA